jgi:phage tail-like protein
MSDEVVYPLPVFHYQVEWGGTSAGFSEVSGLTMENQPIEYRDGLMKESSPVKMPGLQKFSNVTLKRGIVNGDNQFFEWLNSVALNKIERRDVTVSLLNENHEPVVIWKIKKAWPVKLEGPGLKAAGNEVAVESIEIAHEGLTVEHA